MKTLRILLAALALGAVASRVAADEAKPVFENAPDPSSVKLYFPPPPTIDNMLIGIEDPWENFNRRMYSFNALFDRAIFIPVVDGYRFVMPDPAERGVKNFFNNVLEVRNFSNNLLQGNFRDTGVTTLRFVLNTTLGIGGLFDPATRMGFQVRREDFGQTLGKWGVAPGPYLVLPLLGPSGLRDAGGLAVDLGVSSLADPMSLPNVADDTPQRLAYNGVKAVDTRANTEFRYYRTGSPFEYVLVRYAYTRMRQIEVER